MTYQHHRFTRSITNQAEKERYVRFHRERAITKERDERETRVALKIETPCLVGHRKRNRHHVDPPKVMVTLLLYRRFQGRYATFG